MQLTRQNPQEPPNLWQDKERVKMYNNEQIYLPLAKNVNSRYTKIYTVVIIPNSHRGKVSEARRLKKNVRKINRKRVLHKNQMPNVENQCSQKYRKHQNII